MKKTAVALTLAVAVAQIDAACAALVIHSEQVAAAARAAKKACARATQTAAMVLIDQTTIANFERLAALCNAAAGAPVLRREWPQQTAPQSGLPYGATGLFDAQNLAEGMKALIECRRFTEMRASTSLNAGEITAIAQPTKPATGIPVFDPEATVAFVEIRLMCARATDQAPN